MIPPDPAGPAAAPSSADSQLARAREALRAHWGHEDFREGQRAIVEAVLEGRDVLGVLPTGGGKSVCYQVPALVLGGLTLVVSPLIALMHDQVAALEARGIAAASLDSTRSFAQSEQTWLDAEAGRYKLLYCSPERLETDIFAARAPRLDVRLLAVDEAHCVSEWGPQFRPAYRRIAGARELLGDPPIVALTATATPEVRRDIAEHLALRDPLRLVHGFDRPNLTFSVFQTEDKRARLKAVLEGVPGSGVVYAATRKEVETWAAWLERQGETVAFYHAGRSAKDRARAQADWLGGRARLIVATNAFGMGIDKPDVRFVVHVSLSGSLEGYYQEAGRAGRDGQRGYAVLLTAPSDSETQRRLLESGHPTPKQVQAVHDTALSLAQIATGSLPEDPVPVDLEKVAQLTDLSTGGVKTALTLAERAGAWTVVEPRPHRATLRFHRSPAALRKYRDGLSSAALARFVDVLLRAVPSEAFTAWHEVDLRALARRSELPESRVEQGFAFLEKQGVLGLLSGGRGPRLMLLEPRAQRLAVDANALREAQARAEARLASMLRYARGITCRRHFLLGYFGEASPERCGACDVCLGRHKTPVVTREDQPALLDLLRAFSETGTVPESMASESRLGAWLSYLVREGLVVAENVFAEQYRVTARGARLSRRN